MTTFTWASGAVADWTDPNAWQIDFVSPAGPPGAGDTASIVVGTVDLEMPLHDIQIVMQPVQGLTAEIVATNVELGDNVVLTADSAGSSVIYKVVGTGTLDDGNRTDGLAPQAGSIISNVLNFVLVAGGSGSSTFINEGSITGVSLGITADPSATTAVFENDAAIDIGSFNTQVGVTLTGTGVITCGSSGVAGPVGSGQTFDLTGSEITANFVIADLATFQGAVVLGQSHAVFIEGFDSGEKSYSAGVLTFLNGATLRLTPGANANDFIVLPGSAQTDIYAIEANACFAAGTGIATPAGNVAVEHLRPGDRVLLARGGSAEVVWLGHRRLRCDLHPRPHDVWPVRVRAGAFAPGQPFRDLLLSPDHAVFVKGVLIPVRYLVNGATIAQERVAAITYHHVELAAHDVLLAEGLPCESYLDTGNRGAFANGGAIALHPDFAPADTAMDAWARHACADLVLDGPRLAAARRLVLGRAASLGARRTADPCLRLLADNVPLAAQATGRLWRVRLPPATRNLRLRSRAWVPAHMRPAETDTRTLGVAIGRLWLDGREVALDSSGLAAGWHAPEDHLRWTDGDAALEVAGVGEVAFAIALTGTYWRRAAQYSGTRPAASALAS